MTMRPRLRQERAGGRSRQWRALVALTLSAVMAASDRSRRRAARRQPREPADGERVRRPRADDAVAATRPPPPRTVRGGSPAIEKLVEQQSRKPAKRFTPCNLVTEAQARAIVGAPIEQPFEAPAGSDLHLPQPGRQELRHGRGAVASTSTSSSRSSSSAGALTSSDRTAYCGHFGQDMLYVPLSRGRVLSVAAPCDVARQFAAKAVQRLDG